ncbi:MAG: general secretion pathway protein H [Bermanella sp.]|jgi:general secretion pathway protein H|uniref:type II secretion system minor pseudopilin GspH n=1 Tax=Glaciecola sp. 33A TaxID=2057807 RepID=UPI000C326B8D|nr:type II secretion system minor pseudopilin GspH [Glaciecola sp. 33A]PKI03337.1 type II secretion system protein GspH [Glaciecola sp. 33A]
MILVLGISTIIFSKKIDLIKARDNVRKQQTGFTLIEIMLVLALMGLMISVVSYTALGTNNYDKVNQQAKRFQVVFDMASDYAILNQVQLGIRIDEEESTYTYVALDDDDDWVELAGQKLFESYQLPEDMTLQLFLDDLPWQQEEQLFDRSLFDEELSVSDDGVEIGNEEDIVPPPPQLFLLSSGDLTPFELTITFEDTFSNEDPITFTLRAKEVTPIERIVPEDMQQ